MNVDHWRQKPATAIPPLPPLPAAPAGSYDPRVIAIGASTGGTEALREILPRLPAATPGVLVVQHMPAGFTAMFANHLDAICPMTVREAAHGDRLAPGLILVAPGGYHLRLVRTAAGYHVEINDQVPINNHCPAVDVLFHSVAEHAGAHAVAALLTGMGRDGALGLKAIRRNGGRTIAQDAASSVVFGMPREAHLIGAAECLVPLHLVPHKLLSLLAERRS